MPADAGYSGPPVGASGICAMTGASGPGARRPSHVEGVAGLLHLLPDAEPVEHAQGVALQRDAGAEGGEVGLHLEDVDLDAALGEQDGGGGAGDAGADDRDTGDCGHQGDPFVGFGSYFRAMGLTGEPTAPVIGRGGATSRNS